MKGILDDWKEKLLNTNRNNTLINFRETNLANCSIYNDDCNKLFIDITSSKNKKFVKLSNYVKKVNNQKDVNRIIPKDEVLEYLSENGYLNVLDQNKIIIYKERTSEDRTLKNIFTKTKENFEERGIKTLYMAFGFLTWYPTDTAFTEENNSPLLLIPLTIGIDKNGSKDYVVAEDEDTVETNPTLVFALKNQFNITLPKYEDLLIEDPNLDLNGYIAKIRPIFAKYTNWSFSNRAVIGHFDFTKLNMYNDLDNNEAELLKNPIVAQLINQPFDQETNKIVNVEELFQKGKEIELNNVVDADSSQLDAIIQAKSGNSLIIQGPPGTGKSQTITNLIAEFLTANKKVLFVSQKLAALNVVYNNLKKVNLNDFCLQLHSEKANKKIVIEDLYDRYQESANKNIQLDLIKIQNEERELKESQEILNNYAKKIHSKIASLNMSGFDIISKISELRKHNVFDFSIDNIENQNYEDLLKTKEKLDIFQKYLEEMNWDYMSNCWYGHNPDLNNYEQQTNLFDLLPSVFNLINKINEICLEVKEKLNLNVFNLEYLKSFNKFSEAISNIDKISYNLFSPNKIKQIKEWSNQYKNNEDQKNVLANALKDTYKPNIFNIKIEEQFNFFSKYSNSFKRAFSLKYKKAYRNLKDCFIGKKVKYKKLMDDFSILIKWDKLNKENEELRQKINYYQDLTTVKNWDKFNQYINDIYKVVMQNETIQEYANLDEYNLRLKQNIYNSINLKLNKIYETDYKYIDLYQKYFLISYINFETINIDDFINRLKSQINNKSTINTWDTFFKKVIEIEKNNLRPFVEKASKYKNQITSLSKTYEVAFYRQKLELFFRDNPEINNLNRIEHDRFIELFKNKDKIKFELNRLKINANLKNNIPTYQFNSSSSEQAKLIKEYSKKSKKMPIRQLLVEIEKLAFALKPCFLMSPLSVSTYLKNKKDLFDVVIFDEASQVFPWDAIGAISRAKQVIIVGDSKQMPPTNFFNASFEVDEDETFSNDDPANYESILDYAAAYFPQKMLMWHYRSKNEDLISFSNWKFYNNRLITFPSAKQLTNNTGIKFKYVSKGIYDRKTRTNLAEAKEIVKLIKEHYNLYKNSRSLGVVTFNITQQELIEDLIEKEIENDPDLYNEINAIENEPLFIKNLENVQGDERDSIILGTTFGYDSDGRFINNFGPLNQVGGERRLNVSITRARMNLTLVSSIHSSDIKDDLKNIGPKILKNYLQGAEIGMKNAVDNYKIDTNAQADSPFEEEVAEFLEAHNFIVKKQVGCSKFKIDLAVKHHKEDNFVLAIECDGATYHSGRIVRERDRIRQEILEKHGWKFYRIWSTSWIKDKITEQKRLLEAVNKAFADYELQKYTNSYSNNKMTTLDTTNIAKSVVKIVDKEPLKIEELFPIYNTGVDTCEVIWAWNIVSWNQNIVNVAEHIFNNAQPINPGHLAALVKHTLNKKLSYWIKNDEILSFVSRHFASYIKYDCLTNKDISEIELRRPGEMDPPRQLDSIPIIEIAKGMEKIVKISTSISLSDLAKELRTILKVRSFGKYSKNSFDIAINKLLAINKDIVLENETLKYKK